jgi:hypothetical protein
MKSWGVHLPPRSLSGFEILEGDTIFIGKSDRLLGFHDPATGPLPPGDWAARFLAAVIRPPLLFFAMGMGFGMVSFFTPDCGGE